MARPQQVAGGRPNVVAVRLSDKELEALEEMKGSLLKGEYLRFLLVMQWRKSRIT